MACCVGGLSLTALAGCLVTALLPAGYVQVLASVEANMPTANTRTLTSLVWACAMLKIHPGAGWLATWEKAMRPQLGVLSAQEVGG